MKRLMIMLGILLLAGAAPVALAAGGGSGACGSGIWCTGNPTCPDADNDGICNGQDPDYVPGTANPTCPDADGDGICNGLDEDFVPHSGTGRFARMCSAFSWALGMMLR